MILVAAGATATAITALKTMVSAAEAANRRQTDLSSSDTEFTTELGQTVEQERQQSFVEWTCSAA